MSSALVRQALEFVDSDTSTAKKKRGGQAKSASAAGRVNKPPTKKPKSQSKQKVIERTGSPQIEAVGAPDLARAIPQQVIDKLLKLSQPIIDKNTAKRIAKRVVKGKPLVDKIKVNKEPQKSILFPEG